MPSPFPGMDPYLEHSGRWPDFHLRFINYWCEAVADLLPEGYAALIDERVQLQGPDAKPWLTIPDVVIAAHERPAPTAPSERPRAATLEPVAVPLPPLVLDDPLEHDIRIVKLPERSLVTVLQILSPANKEEPCRSDYFSKRNAFMRRHVNVVELDLLLRGQRLPMGGPLPPGHFYALVSRRDGGGLADVYPWTIRDPLPSLPIPLHAPDPDLWFDLGTVFATAYERARYARVIAYDDPLTLPLGEADRAWARERVEAYHSGRVSPG